MKKSGFMKVMFVVQLVENTSGGDDRLDSDIDAINDMEARLQSIDNQDRVIVEFVKYSHNELKSLADIAQEFMKTGYHIVRYAVDVMSNTFSIVVETNNYEKVLASDLYAKVQELPIKFEAGEATEAAVDLIGGEEIFSGTGARSTIGFGGYYNTTTPVILTCGHGNPKNNNIFYAGSKTGSVTICRANQSPSTTGTPATGDFSIVSLTDNAPTNQVMGNGAIVKLNGTENSPSIGQLVIKYGKSSGYGTYRILAVDVYTEHYLDLRDPLTQEPYREYYYTYGMVETIIGTGTNVTSGDSGGPVYMSTGSTYKALGTISSRSSSGARLYYSPIKNAVAAGFTPKLY